MTLYTYVFLSNQFSRSFNRSECFITIWQRNGHCSFDLQIIIIHIIDIHIDPTILFLLNYHNHRRHARPILRNSSRIDRRLCIVAHWFVAVDNYRASNNGISIWMICGTCRIYGILIRRHYWISIGDRVNWHWHRPQSICVADRLVVDIGAIFLLWY